PPTSTLFPYTTLFRSPARTAQQQVTAPLEHDEGGRRVGAVFAEQPAPGGRWRRRDRGLARERRGEDEPGGTGVQPKIGHGAKDRSEEHTSELQSRGHL